MGIRLREHEYVGWLNRWLMLVTNVIILEEFPHSSALSSLRSLSA